MALRQKLSNLQTGRIMYKQPEYTCEFINVIHDLFFFSKPSTNVLRTKVFKEILFTVSIPSPSIILVATVATLILMMPVAASAVMVTVAALMVIVVPAVAVLLVAAGRLFICVALISAAVVRM